MAMATCTEWAEESYDQCSASADRGYNSCDAWDADCCDWWPCSWGCELITWVCMGWTWISNVVCVVWTTVWTSVCITWEVGSVLLTPLAGLIEMTLAIPIFGRITNITLNLAAFVIGRLSAIPDLILSAIGVRPLKKMRLCVVILRDEKGAALIEPEDAVLQAEINAARDMWRDLANIEIFVEDIRTVDSASPTYALDIQTGGTGVLNDLWLTGTYFESAAGYCGGALGRVAVIGKTLLVFRVRTIDGGSRLGDELWVGADYVAMADTSKMLNCVTLAHEIGHRLGLLHCCGTDNLMHETSCLGTSMGLEGWQINIARNSEYASYI